MPRRKPDPIAPAIKPPNAAESNAAKDKPAEPVQCPCCGHTITPGDQPGAAAPSTPAKPDAPIKAASRAKPDGPRTHNAW